MQARKLPHQVCQPKGSLGARQGLHRDAHTQQPLKQSQINSGAFRMLEKRTGMTQQQLQQLFASSGARNFGQFVSAIVVSKNLGLNTNTLLTDLKTMSLGKALQSMGVPSKDSKAAIKKANEEIKDADIVIGAVLVPGGRTPVLITRAMLRLMKKGAVIVDMAAENGGNVSGSRRCRP